MTRLQRYPSVHVFHDRLDFDTALYEAVRKSPWWLLSLALHALVFAVALLLPSGVVSVEEKPQARFDFVSPPEPPIEELPVDPTPVDPVRADDIPVPDPKVNPEQIADKPMDDMDQPFDETYGKDEGMATGPFEGPSENPVIGPGGGAGAFRGRGRGGDRSQGRPGGRGGEDVAVEHALAWLAAHQSPDGGWEAAGFDRWCDGRPAPEGGRPDGLGAATNDVGVTGLALLGAGYTNRGQHPFARVVSRGLRYLRNVQDPEGCFGPRTSGHHIYSHATSALAMVEAYGMTGSTIWKAPAQRALDFIAIARNPYLAWRYGVKPGDNDLSVSGWMMMALKSARLVNEDAAARGQPVPFQLDLDAFDGLLAWVDKMTDPDSGRAGYIQRGTGPARPQDLVDRFPSDKSESMTAVAVLARVFLGQDPRQSAAVKKGAALMAALPPQWTPDGRIDMYYWYYGTLAMFQVGGEAWRGWNAAMQPAIVGTQRSDGDFCGYKGSWDPVGPWGPEGGRVYSTALLAMCLEVYYRYDRVFGGR
jgi:hypothetical protein